MKQVFDYVEPIFPLRQVIQVRFEPAEPLWMRAPTRDHQGRLLSDFMMIIPGLSEKPSIMITRTVRNIRMVLTLHKKHVIFADLNLKLNVLWVTVKPGPRTCFELAAAIHFQVPDAKLVSHQVHY